ncbi:unnamed protein product [Rotaria magnacalcarata]|uniref:Uncharacterized protein n=1 Tax=Rotaria magnacalcarata TaxID=392030 RepID=A0A816ZBL5_9BILA|nr:unnamed protein product [Rotaria magnacalcarata]
MPIVCVCCDARLEPKNRRPFRGIALRLFVGARRNGPLSNSGFICNVCRICFRSWRNNLEFVKILDRVEEECNENIADMDIEDHLYDEDSIIDKNDNEPMNTNFVTIPMNVTLSSHQQCSVCRKLPKSSMHTIPEEDRELLFIRSNILIPKGSRCCEDHVFNGRLRVETLNEVRPFKITDVDFSSTDILTRLNKFRDYYNSIRYFDFDPPFTMSEFDCYNLIGLSKSNFEDLIQSLTHSKINHSHNRSLRNAVGLFLTKLRLGISNKVLTTLFQFSNQKAVARTLDAVREVMILNFVPHHLGFNHISRQDVISSHSSPLATRLLTDQPNTVVLVIDGTYLYIQVRKDLYFVTHTSGISLET